MSYIMKTTRIPEQLSQLGLPPAGSWTVDGSRSSVAFSGRSSRLAPTVKASFSDVQGELHLAADLAGSSVNVGVDVRTITTGNPLWDEMLRVADPFRSHAFPLARYVSTEVRWTRAGFAVDGVLDIAGASAALALTATVSETAGDTVTLRATGAFDPKAAGVRLDMPGSRLWMPRTLQLSIAAIAARSRVTGRRFALAS
jgi:polyisoprenoid-binding protein YceI